MMQPGETMVVLGALAVIGVVAYPLAVAWARKIESEAKRAELPGGADRIARMETVLEAMSIEVERISEGQRFVTKLIAERPEGAQLPPGGASR